MALPVVAIIGRPNVGKSSLLNALAGKMISIVEPTAGVTRDRVTAIIESDSRYFELVDTGGYGIVDSDQLSSHVENQIHQAVASADLVIFVTDIRTGVLPLDVKIAQMLRKAKLNVICVANKADSARLFSQAGEFTRLGFGDALCISATNNMNKAILLEKIESDLDHLPKEKPEKAVMKLALVGKRNAGKSTFINSLAGQERVIVSEIPGTTRDAVDVRFEKDGQTFLAIDTAGVRKKNKMSDDIEYYSYTRATHSIGRADVILFLIDSTLKISQVDKRLARFICDEFKACILVINKWDLARDFASTGEYHDYIDKVLPGLSYAPIAFTTATDGKNMQSVLDLATELFKQATTEVSTALLNKVVERINDEHIGGSRKKGGVPKIFYATQVAISPVTLLLFVNKPHLFDDAYQRYVVGRLHEMLGIDEVPIRLLMRKRRSERS